MTEGEFLFSFPKVRKAPEKSLDKNFSRPIRYELSVREGAIDEWSDPFQ